MFSENQIKVYKSISAPDELKQRILSLEKTEKKSVPKVRNIGIYVAAACLVLVISLSGVFGGNDFSASINGETVGTEKVSVQPSSGVAMLDARALNELSVDFEMETGKTAEISVTDGNIQISDYSTGEVKEGNTARGKNIVRWSVNAADESKVYEMTVTFKNGEKHTITLEYDHTAKSWMAYNK